MEDPCLIGSVTQNPASVTEMAATDLQVEQEFVLKRVAPDVMEMAVRRVGVAEGVNDVKLQTLLQNMQQVL